MKFLSAQRFFWSARRWLALLAGIVAVSGVRGADTQPSRFLLVFETSSASKKNLPAIRQTLDKLFSSNLQNEIQGNDDLAVWTVDQDLHTGTFPLASWSPEDAVMYSTRLNEFLGRQKFSRHASLAAIQPLLNRVMKNSERLTVLIFCDGQGHLLGTPYDAGVNEIITNAAAKAKSAPAPFILVLRSYRGEYLGCSVNRSVPLNFPKFPPPPKPEPPPVSKPAVVTPPVVVVPPAVVAPVPAIIIVGTNASTNASAVVKLPSVVMPPPITNFPATNPAANPPPAPAPVLKAVTVPPVTPPLFTNLPAPALATVPQRTSAPVVVITVPATIPLTNPLPLPPSNVVAAVEEAPPNNSALWPTVIGGGALAAAAGLVAWLVVRSRRPRGSLITSSMQNDTRLPPRK